MSGKPNYEGVKQLRQACRDLLWARDRIEAVEKALKEKQAELATYKAEQQRAYEKIRLGMEQMDVASPGNHGWDVRHFEFLLMLAQE